MLVTCRKSWWPLPWSCMPCSLPSSQKVGRKKTSRIWRNLSSYGPGCLPTLTKWASKPAFFVRGCSVWCPTLSCFPSAFQILYKFLLWPTQAGNQKGKRILGNSSRLAELTPCKSSTTTVGRCRKGEILPVKKDKIVKLCSISLTLQFQF